MGILQLGAAGVPDNAIAAAGFGRRAVVFTCHAWRRFPALDLLDEAFAERRQQLAPPQAERANELG